MALSTTTFPYNTIVRITDTIGGGSFQGSGVLISPDEVLTASHVVYSQGIGPATNVVVSPGYNGTAPYGTATGSFIHYFSIADQNDLISNADSQFDYAVIHLSRPFTGLGTGLGTMGLSANFPGGAVTVSGYPASAYGQQVDTPETVTDDPRYTLLDGVSIGAGSSGGPVWIGGAADPQVVGLVSSSSLTSNTGYFTEITSAALQTIERWVAIDDGTASAGGVVVGYATTVGAEFDTLQASAAAGKLVSITFVDAGTATLPLSLSQLLSDGQAMGFIRATFEVSVGAVGLRGSETALAGEKLGASTRIDTVQFADGQMDYNASSPAAEVVRLYQAALDRAPDQVGEHGFIDAIKAGGTLQQLAAGFVGSAEFQQRFGGASSDAGFVTQLYANVLGRAPDAGGLQGWVAQLGAGVSRAQVLVGFSESAENMADTGATVSAGIWDLDVNAPQVARLYDTVLGRAPDAAGLQGWDAQLDSLALPLQVVANEFVASAEFTARYGALSNQDFVNALYVNSLHRAPDAAGASGWVQALNTQGLSRAGVVLGFSESAEHQANMTAAIFNPTPALYGVKLA